VSAAFADTSNSKNIDIKKEIQTAFLFLTDRFSLPHIVLTIASNLHPFAMCITISINIKLTVIQIFIGRISAQR